MLTRYYDVNVKINNRISTNPKEITVIVFLDIYQAFVTVEHPFLYEISFNRKKCYADISSNCEYLQQISCASVGCLFILNCGGVTLIEYFVKLQH